MPDRRYASCAAEMVIAHSSIGRGDMIKILWHDGLGLSLYAKRLERGRFVWPPSLSPPSSAAERVREESTLSISAAQLAYLLSGIDWRNPVHTFRPERAGYRGQRPPEGRGQISSTDLAFGAGDR